jgi:hypothetical protein
MPGPVLGTDEMDKNSCPYEAYILLLEEIENKISYKIYSMLDGYRCDTK